MEEEKKIEEAEIEENTNDASNEENENQDEINEEKVPVDPIQARDQKIKNLISAIILLAGLFVGSLFVDVAQMVKGGGFSQRALESADVFSSGSKTWVAYAQPLVKVQVISDDKCDKCKPDEVLVGLKQAIPTMSNEKIDANSAQGKKLIATYNIKTIPAFIFSKEIEKTDLFAKAQPFLDKQGDSYAIKTAQAGFPVGKYVSAPDASDKDIKLGSADSKVKIVTFSDFQNPLDKKFYQGVVTPMLKDYGDKVQLVFKNYLAPQAAQGQAAANAAACANDQGKFAQFADKLFASQDAWSKAKDAAPILKGYAAALGLNTGDFNKCFDDKKYQDTIKQSFTDGQSFGLQATPSMFVGTDLQASGVKYDDVKKAIDAQLAN